MTSGGGVAISDDKLCLAGWSAGSFDLKTGDWKVAGGAGFGGEVGVLCNKWVLRGGGRLTEPLSAQPLNGGFSMGVPGATSLPAWDAELVLFASGGLLAVPTDKYVAWKEGKLPAPPAPAVPVAGSQTNNAATAPTNDMAVVALGDARKVVAFRRADGSKVWSVDLPDQPAMNRLAINRDGRVLVSLCDGSIICLEREKK